MPSATPEQIKPPNSDDHLLYFDLSAFVPMATHVAKSLLTIILLLTIAMGFYRIFIFMS